MFNLPIPYALRNLARRPWHSFMTVAGVGVIVFAAAVMLSLNRGLNRRIGASGEDQNIRVISRAGQNIMFSSITEDELVHLSSIPGIALDAFGLPLVSPEIMHMSIVEGVGEDGPSRAPVYLRGVTPTAYEVHRSIQIVEGRLPEEENEILVGKTSHIKIGLPEEALATGRTLRFENEDWIISGRFEASGSLVESEIWIDNDTLKRVLRRTSDTFAVIGMSDQAAVEGATALFSKTGALERYFKGWPETEYYREFGAALSWVLLLSLMMVVIISLAGALIGANTMYTAVMNRMREIATYRVLGFGKGDILVSFLTESVVLALAGGVLGVACGAGINGLPLKLSYGAFYLVADATVLGSGLALALVIGFVGGLFPALKGLGMTVMDGLRHG